MLLARLVTGRYGNRSMDYQGSGNSSAETKAGWLSRLFGTILGRKSAA